MKKNLRIFAATMMAFVMTIAMTGCGTEPSTSREEPTTVVSNTTESSAKEETVTQEPVTEEPVAQETETQEPSTETTTTTGPVEFTLAAVGGMYFDDAIISAAKDAGGYDYLFEDAKPFIEGSDVAIGVVQTPLSRNEAFDIGSAISTAGFDVINVATTNSLDNGVDGFNTTVGQIFCNGVETCGVNSDLYPCSKICYLDVKGVKVAFISGAEGIVVEDEGIEINSIDEDLIVSQIEEAKSEGAMVIVVSLNYVDKGQTKPEKDDEDFYNRLGEAGAQIVLCSGIKDFMFTTDKMDFQNGIYGRYFASLGCFISDESDTSSLIRIKVKIDETGFVDTVTERLDAKAFYIDSNDHYKLVPVNASDIDVYPESVKTFAEQLYGSRNEIN